MGGVMAATLQVSAQPAPPKPLRCIDPGDDPVMVGLSPRKLTYCFETGKNNKVRCYTSELDTGRVAEAMAPPPAGEWPRLQPRPGRPKVTITAKAAKVCRGTTCKTLTPKGRIDEGLGLGAVTNDAGTLAALSSREWIETFDVTTGKRLAQFKSASDCTTLKFAGDVLVVSETECGSSKGPRWLASKTGTKIAVVGGTTPIESSSFAQVKDSQWAFSSRKGDLVVIQDVSTGKVIKQITVGPALTDDGVVTMLGDGTWLALVFGGARAGDLAIINVATSALTSYPGTRCAAP